MLHATLLKTNNKLKCLVVKFKTTNTYKAGKSIKLLAGFSVDDHFIYNHAV